jgi:hypothetical protein
MGMHLAVKLETAAPDRHLTTAKLKKAAKLRFPSAVPKCQEQQGSLHATLDTWGADQNVPATG